MHLQKTTGCTLLILFGLLLTGLLAAQHQADHWYFGQYAAMAFNNGQPAALSDSKMYAPEGCATISHPKTGQLLFYTSGEKVWNRQHEVMPNGTGLHGFISSIQSAVIVPAPCDSNQYYIFTADGATPDIINGRSAFPYDSTFSSR
ncbi:MAG: hypothetical protein U5L96_19195 [Owenweeksia sp.]|nr:hypothetical protein [Owenweeksia sp.]